MRNSGVTLAEMLVALTVFSVVMMALVGSSVALQRSFAATDDYFSREGDQLRILDYFCTDLRRALAVGLNSNTVTYKGTSFSNTIPSGATKYLTVVIPNYRDSASSNRFPTVSSDAVNYGGSPVTVSYYLLGSSVYRVESDPDLASGNPLNNARNIADNVTDFKITDSTIVNTLFSDTVISVSATFAPKYSNSLWTSSLSTTSTTASRIGTTVGCKIKVRNL